MISRGLCECEKEIGCELSIIFGILVLKFLTFVLKCVSTSQLGRRWLEWIYNTMKCEHFEWVENSNSNIKYIDILASSFFRLNYDQRKETESNRVLPNRRKTTKMDQCQPKSWTNEEFFLVSMKNRFTIQYPCVTKKKTFLSITNEIKSIAIFSVYIHDYHFELIHLC